MTEDVTRIRVGKNTIGITGLKSVLEELATSHSETSDDEVRRLMLDRLSRDNYIPNTARDEYGNAFVREFRKFLGQAREEPPERELTIQVLGPGCSQCERLEHIVMQILTEMNLGAFVEHVKNVKEIGEFGVMGAPALVINGKVVCVGKIPPVGKIKEWLLEAK
ncbi:MAG: thioredoxin family protein [Deltaproteobacteria bacterium]|nr:thioredoxin family protein [Deltaproteobacteria bacterium]